jgi:hypothetical protein
MLLISMGILLPKNNKNRYAELAKRKDNTSKGLEHLSLSIPLQQLQV